MTKTNRKGKPASIFEEWHYESMAKEYGLNTRQEIFCMYYFRYQNASKAYRLAYGCSERVANVNGSRLLKKLKTEFRDAVPALNSFTQATPARFENLPAEYFIQTGENLVKIPRKQNEFYKIFGDNKNEVESFVKKQKLKVNQELDLIRLVQFLNTQ